MGVARDWLVDTRLALPASARVPQWDWATTSPCRRIVSSPHEASDADCNSATTWSRNPSVSASKAPCCSHSASCPSSSHGWVCGIPIVPFPITDHSPVRLYCSKKQGRHPSSYAYQTDQFLLLGHPNPQRPCCYPQGRTGGMWLSTPVWWDKEQNIGAYIQANHGQSFESFLLFSQAQQLS
jgi:hypothetical protein